jgi:hypothetical protein
MTEYKARVGSSFGDIEAQEIGEIIENLKDIDGHVSSRSILNHAKDESSILHKHFEWDETIAAKKYNMHQARSILSHVVEIVIVAENPVLQRSFHSVSVPDKGRVYVNLQTALDNPTFRKQLIDKAIKMSTNLTTTLEMFRDQ